MTVAGQDDTTNATDDVAGSVIDDQHKLMLLENAVRALQLSKTGAIVMGHAWNVWVDSVWLPTLSFTMAKRAFHEWLEVMPSDRIMWGGDCHHAEGIYGATEFTRRCLAEVLAEKMDAGDLTEEHALRIGRQILRENALQLFPTLNDGLWKHKGRLVPPADVPATRPFGPAGE